MDVPSEPGTPPDQFVLFAHLSLIDLELVLWLGANLDRLALVGLQNHPVDDVLQMRFYVVDKLIIFEVQSDASDRWNNHCSNMVAHLEILFFLALSSFVEELVTVDVGAIGVELNFLEVRRVGFVWEGF